MAVDGIVVSVMTGTNTGGISILKVSGYLDTTTAGELESALYGLLDRGIYKVVVDLAGVNYISSAGWGIFDILVFAGCPLRNACVRRSTAGPKSARVKRPRRFGSRPA